jgi:hypothetical protein
VHVEEVRSVWGEELEWVQELREWHDVQVFERLLLAVFVGGLEKTV